MANTFFSVRGMRIKNFENFMLNSKGNEPGIQYDPETNPEGMINFGVAENTLSEDIIAKKLSTPEVNTYEGHMQYYFDFRGLKSFREALAKFLEERFKSASPIDPEHLIVTSGVGAGLDLLSYMLCDPGDCTLVFAPYYSAIAADVGMRGEVNCITVQLSSSSSEGRAPFEVDIEETELAIQKALSEGKKMRMAILLNPHNPTGDILSAEKLVALLELFNKYDMHVVLDEIYGLSLFEGKSFTSVLSLKSLPNPEKTHFVWGFAKDFCLSGFRCGVIYSQRKDLSSACTHLLYLASVPAVVQCKLKVLISDKEWLDSEYFPRNLERLKESYTYFRKHLEEMGVKVHGTRAGLFLWADLRNYLPSPNKEEEMKLFQDFLDAMVYCVPGTGMFYEEPGWYRFTFAHKKPYLKIGLDRLRNVLEKRKTIFHANANGLKFVPGDNGINGTSKSLLISDEP